MPIVEPFRALRPASADPGVTLAPPYDVIDAEQLARLHAASDRNVSHLTLPEGESPERYARAARLLSEWRKDGSLALDERPSLTVYEMATADATLVGVFAAVDLADPENGGVLPHETTYDRIVQDRLDLLTATSCNLEPVFLLAYGADALTAALDTVREREPALDASALGARHRAWVITGDNELEERTAELSAATLVIADGHHRWRTAQRYAAAAPDVRARRSHLAFIAHPTGGGLSLKPTHRYLVDTPAGRLLAHLGDRVEVEDLGRLPPARLAEVVEERRPSGRLFGLWAEGAASLMRLRDGSPLPGDLSPAWRDLDVAVLQSLLEGLAQPGFAHDPDDAAASAGSDGCALILASPPVAAVRDVAEAGEAMPQKSTLFTPKPASGIVLRPLLP